MSLLSLNFQCNINSEKNIFFLRQDQYKNWYRAAVRDVTFVVLVSIVVPALISTFYFFSSFSASVLLGKVFIAREYCNGWISSDILVPFHNKHHSSPDIGISIGIGLLRVVSVKDVRDRPSAHIATPQHSTPPPPPITQN